MKDFKTTISAIQKEDPRYAYDAYAFVQQALDYTLEQREKTGDPLCLRTFMLGNNPSRERHVDCKELLEGIREFTLEQYGPMSLLLLHAWGIKACEDFGNIVFNMVNKDLLGKSDRDSPEDFRRGFDFVQAFMLPFLPEEKLKMKRSGKKSLKSAE